MGFLQWWRGWFVILVCSFSILKILHCPPVFIWETFDQLQHQAEQQPGMAGMTAKKQDMQNMQVPHFKGFHTNLWCIWRAWLREHFLCAETMCRHTKVPLPSISIPDIQHPLCYLLPHSLLTDLHSLSLQAWPSMVTMFTHFFSLCTISPFLKFTEAWQVGRYPLFIT